MAAHSHNSSLNPAVSPEQYRLAQAVLSGTVREPVRMTKKVARELVEKTPAHLRSEWSRYTVENPNLNYAVWTSQKGERMPTVMHFSDAEKALKAANEIVGYGVANKVQVIHTSSGQILHTWERGSWKTGETESVLRCRSRP